MEPSETRGFDPTTISQHPEARAILTALEKARTAQAWNDYDYVAEMAAEHFSPQANAPEENFPENQVVTYLSLLGTATRVARHTFSQHQGQQVTAENTAIAEASLWRLITTSEAVSPFRVEEIRTYVQTGVRSFAEKRPFVQLEAIAHVAERKEEKAETIAKATPLLRLVEATLT